MLLVVAFKLMELSHKFFSQASILSYPADSCGPQLTQTLSSFGDGGPQLPPNKLFSGTSHDTTTLLTGSPALLHSTSRFTVGLGPQMFLYLALHFS